MGRPRKEEHERLYNFTVRLSAADRLEITRKAKQAGVSRSEYLRLCAVYGTLQMISAADPALLRNLLAIGNNLNQIARRLNTSDRESAHLDATLSVLGELLDEARGSYGS